MYKPFCVFDEITVKRGKKRSVIVKWNQNTSLCVRHKEESEGGVGYREFCAEGFWWQLLEKRGFGRCKHNPNVILMSTRNQINLVQKCQRTKKNLRGGFLYFISFIRRLCFDTTIPDQQGPSSSKTQTPRVVWIIWIASRRSGGPFRDNKKTQPPACLSRYLFRSKRDDNK